MTDPAPDRHETEVRGARLSWTETGTGPTVVWAHGMSSSGWAQELGGQFDWSPVSDSGHRLVRFDARGHGSSTGTSNEGDYVWPELAQDLLALLDHIAPGEQVAGVGSSMGTATLIYAALAEPSRFRRLVLTSAPTAWQTRAAQAGMYLGLASLIESEGLDAFRRLMASPEAHVPAPFEGLDPDAFTPQVSVELLPTVLRGAAQTDLPPIDAIAALDVPVLLLPWSDDPGHPVATSEALLEALPDARLQLGTTLAELRAWGHVATDFLAS
ncbi:alpha/beta fold hydrolase [Gryllotalpicola protaetiae]|uniref:Alpha/beta hydrolase n=1 Tax=Gryllotalpicola protaetiae TaxID=2419771 RepID=A0A387BJ26_9MICO|nr:alpha/beta hydrolase [Gryllotalpicola protaetiae]AYG02232.1 alpha/beta hydrolase [Gryllotalpicola protaetiae]